MSILSWPYGKAPGTGAWGVPSSNHNFCEEDYVITKYIAEFVNTLTNLTYIFYGACGIRRVRSRKDGGIFSTLAFPYWALAGVGLLSGWFHMTLNFHSQMGDDLSMFLAVGAALHQVSTFDTTVATRRIVTLSILGVLIPVSIYHCWADEIYVHEIVFAGMVFLVGRKTRALIRTRVKNEEAQKRLGNMATMAISTGLFGYFLWNIDFHLCSYVTAFKRQLGLPWAFIFELHGWWHIFTGIGAYIGMALVEYIVTLEDEQTDKNCKGFGWPVEAMLRDVNEKKIR
ncbi:alkaline ceramidase-like protein [Dendryphion nanum]|uniref:Alkaline ceramidase-like protein n=1 Tax=Dendryphion nanum TaxID=256645 RepID=A0A9P9IRK7_9PLEO|nr:alkaline ceramidase-like protein [Dendryphion nanum]